YRAYRKADVPGSEQDRYLNEYRQVAEMLGARDVPASRAQLRDYFAAIQSELRYDERSRQTLEILATMPLPIMAAGLSRRVFLGAGAALLPDWGRRLLGRSRRQRALDRAAATTLKRSGPVIRLSMSKGVAWRSAQRVGVSPACLHFD